jgi:hypothetical protein
LGIEASFLCYQTNPIAVATKSLKSTGKSMRGKSGVCGLLTVITASKLRTLLWS